MAKARFYILQPQGCQRFGLRFGASQNRKPQGIFPGIIYVAFYEKLD